MTRKTIGWTGLIAIAAGFMLANWPAHGFLYAVALLALLASMFIVVMICLWLIANDAASVDSAASDEVEVYGDYPHVASIDGMTYRSLRRGSGLVN